MITSVLYMVTVSMVLIGISVCVIKVIMANIVRYVSIYTIFHTVAHS